MNQDHIQNYKQLLAVLAALLTLTALTVWVSRFDFGGLNIWLTLLIASSKSSLVLLFFMHLKHENRVIQLGFIVTIVVVALLISFLFWDISFR